MTLDAMNSTSRESQGRTTLGFVHGVPDEKGVKWAVRQRMGTAKTYMHGFRVSLWQC